jgi:hypothetical protein
MSYSNYNLEEGNYILSNDIVFDNRIVFHNSNFDENYNNNFTNYNNIDGINITDILQNILADRLKNAFNTSNIDISSSFNKNFNKNFKKTYSKYINNDHENNESPNMTDTSLLLNNENTETESETNHDKKILKKNELIGIIVNARKKINENLFLVSAKYDDIYYKYNAISVAIMILSTVATFTEAVRLTMSEYIKSNDITYINVETLALIMNIYLLASGTVVTVLSSIVRFKNYRELMEKLKNMQSTYNKYKLNYEKQERDMILYFDSTNYIDPHKYNQFKIILDEYNKEIKDINFYEDIRTKEIIKLNKVKAEYDIKLKNINKTKELNTVKIDNEYMLKEIAICNNKEINELKLNNKKIISMKKLEDSKDDILANKNNQCCF